MAGWDGGGIEFELWDRTSDSMLVMTDNAPQMAQIVQLAIEARPDKVDNLYLMGYNTYNGKRDDDEWGPLAEGADELDEWATRNEV